jgi:hypothetical protein
VPERLQEAVARVLNAGRDRQVHLKKSLGTKSLDSFVDGWHLRSGAQFNMRDASARWTETKWCRMSLNASK